MKLLKIGFIAITSMIFFLNPQPSQGKLYKYTDLQMEDYDELKKVRDVQIEKAKNLIESEKGDRDEKEDQAQEILRETLQMILSRPSSNADDMVSKLLPGVRSELNRLGMFYETLGSLVSEALLAVSQKKLTTVYKVTSYHLLKNTMSELKSTLKSGGKVQRNEALKILRSIRDAKIKLPKDVVTKIRMRQLSTAESPSKTAENLLKPYEPKKKG